MKRKYLCKIAGLLVAMQLITSSVFSQVALSKEEKKSFWLNKNASVEIENKYGNIIVEMWNRDSIRFEVQVSVNAKNRESAEELLDRIEFQGTSTGDFLTYRTVFQPYKGKVKTFFRDLLEADKSNVSVDYIVYFPQKADLTIVNKFGDVFLSDFEKEFHLDLSYGDLKAINLTGESNIQLSYGKLKVKTLRSGKIDLKNAEANIKEAADLELVSNGSDIEIDEVKSLNVEIQRGDLTIREINSIKAEGSFAGISIGHLKGTGVFDMKLSNINVDKIDPKFEKIRIVQRNTNVDLNIAKLSFVLSAHMKGGDFSYPNSITNFKSTYIDYKKEERNIDGKIGTDPKSKIIVDGSNGRIHLFK